LLTATNRPLWADTPLLGLLFLLSGISAAAAALLLLGWRRTHPASLSLLGQIDSYAMGLELAVLVVMVVTLGAVATAVLGNGWGVALLSAPSSSAPWCRWPPFSDRASWALPRSPVAAVLGLAGSFVLRSVIVLASEASSGSRRDGRQIATERPSALPA
jgi:formate-dependent nitrite reductase membrane component NrfD